MNGFFTHDFAADQYLHIDVTQRAVGNKDAVFYGTETLIGQRPSGFIGHIHGITVGINTFCSERISGSGCKIIIFRIDFNASENAGRGNIGNDENAVNGRAFRAVAGNRTHHTFLFTDTF